jgi:hypothetical protein
MRDSSLLHFDEVWYRELVREVGVDTDGLFMDKDGPDCDFIKAM